MSAINAQFPTTFEAHWPKSLDPALQSLCTKISNFFWYVISILLFPFTLAAKAIRYVAYYAIIPPMSFRDDPANFKEQGDHLIRFHRGQRVTIKTADNITLSGSLFPGTKHPKKAILYASGNAQEWETAHQEITRLKKTGVTILYVNPRTNDHTVPDEQGFALDVWSSFEYLTRQGIDPNDIVTIGYSLGGARGAVGLKLVQDHFPEKKINFINERSLGNLSTEVYYYVGKVFEYLGHYVPVPSCILNIVSLVASYISYYGLWLIGGDIDAKSALLSLKGKVCVIHHPKDQIIPKPAQMITALQGETQKKFTSIEMESTNDWLHHQRDFTKNEEKALFKELSSMLNIPIHVQ